MSNDYNNKRFYWIKLRDTFMTSDAVDFLMSQKDGANYVVLYQMLCLKTINTNGELSRTIGEVIIPYDIDKIVRDTKWFSKDTIIVALELYKKLGLIFTADNGNLVISNFSKMVGSETQNALYKREKKELENFQVNSNRYKEIKSIDIRDIDKAINKEKINKKESKNNDFEILSYIESNFGITIGGTHLLKIEDLLKTYNDEILCYAIDKCIENNAKTLSYFYKVVENWKQCDFKTIEEVKIGRRIF